MALTQITEKGIKDGEIINADINASAAIAKSKIETFVNNNADNRVITGSGTANTLNGESVLTFDSSTDTLQIHQQNNSNNPALKVIHRGGSSSDIGFHYEAYDGSGDVVITNSGNIGIGTTNPTSPDGSNADNSLNGPVLTIYGDSPAINLTSSTTGSDDYSLINFGRTGSSSNPYRAVIAYKQSDDILRINANNHIAFDVGSNLGSNELMRLDGTGKVGIGTTSPSGKLHVNSGKLRVDGGATARTLDVETTHSSGGEIASFQNNANNAYGGLVISGGEIDRETRLEAAWGSGFLTFWTDNGERYRVDSGGNIGIGTTQPTNADSADGGLQIRPNHSQGSPQIGFKRASGGSASSAVIFVNGNVGKGSITYDASGTAYNTSSDYRLKENVVSISDGITRLKTLKPSRFNFIDDETNTLRDGFLAHEVSSIVPEAISGTKDEVDENKKPIYQEIDQSKIVPLLTAALQEAIAKIEVLETKVAALEAA